MSCDICRGSGKITLPVYREVQMKPDPDLPLTPTAMATAARNYPCPECQDHVDMKRLGVLQRHRDLVILTDDGYMRAAQTAAARELVDQLLREGYIQFEMVRTEESGPDSGQLRAVLGVVHPGVVATMEQRIAARQEEVANQAANEAVRQINNWGAHYGRTWVEKDLAAERIFKAIRTVVEKRAEWRKLEDA